MCSVCPFTSQDNIYIYRLTDWLYCCVSLYAECFVSAAQSRRPLVVSDRSRLFPLANIPPRIWRRPLTAPRTRAMRYGTPVRPSFRPSKFWVSRWTARERAGRLWSSGLATSVLATVATAIVQRSTVIIHCVHSTASTSHFTIIERWNGLLICAKYWVIPWLISKSWLTI